MARTTQQNFLNTKPDGSTGAVFPGGVDILADGNRAAPGTDRSIKWTAEADGSLVAQVFGYRPVIGSVDFRGLEIHAGNRGDEGEADIYLVAENNASSGPPANTGETSLDIYHSRNNGFYSPANDGIFIRCGLANNPALTLINGARQSSFAQWRDPINLRMQSFQTTIASAPVGTVTAAISLPTGWNNNHTGVMVSAIDYGASGVGATMQASVLSLTQFNIRVWNNPVIQNISVQCLSFGN